LCGCQAFSIYAAKESPAAPLHAHFCSQYVPALFEAYKATPDGRHVTPYTYMLAALLERGHFASFTRTPQEREMLGIQIRRIANHEIEKTTRFADVYNVNELLNYLIVYAYHDGEQVSPVIEEPIKSALRAKIAGIKEWYETNMGSAQWNPVIRRRIALMSETLGFLDGVLSPANMLGSFGKRVPLVTCGHTASDCWNTGAVPSKVCSACKCIRHCGTSIRKRIGAVTRKSASCPLGMWLRLRRKPSNENGND